MKTSLLDISSLYLIIIFLVIAIGSIAFLFFNRNLRVKQILRYPIVFGNVFLFLFVLWFPEIPMEVLWFGIPAAIIISIVLARRIKFCKTCGQTVEVGVFISQNVECPTCGGAIS